MKLAAPRPPNPKRPSPRMQSSRSLPVELRAATPHDRRWLLVAVMVAVALALRVPLLGRSVWFDEACMSDQRIGTWPQLLATLYVDIHPPLYVLFMHLWNGVFGDGALSMRLPPLLVGLACIPLTFWTGRRLGGDAAALWAALLLTLSPVHIWYCAEARLYTPMIACTLLAFGTFDRLLDPAVPHRRGRLVLHVANITVMLALHYYLAVFVVVLAALAPLYGRGAPARARAIEAWHGAGIILLAGFVALKTAMGEFETSQDYLRAFDLKQFCAFVAGWCWTGNTIAPPDVDSPAAHAAALTMRSLGVVLLAIGTLHVVRNARTQPRALLVPIGIATLPAFLLVLTATGYDETYLERSIIPALPFVLLLAGAGIAALRGPLHVVAGVAATACALIAVYGLFQNGSDHWTVYKPNSDWRAAAAWLGQEIDGGGAGRPVYTSTPNPRPLSYYDQRIQDVKNLEPPKAPEEVRRSVGKYLGGAFGAYAERTYREFVAFTPDLRGAAKLLVRQSESTPAAMVLPPDRPDDVCYLVRDAWHPAITANSTIEDLLRHPAVKLLAEQRFTGITVYKVRIAP